MREEVQRELFSLFFFLWYSFLSVGIHEECAGYLKECADDCDSFISHILPSCVCVSGVGGWVLLVGSVQLFSTVTLSLEAKLTPLFAVLQLWAHSVGLFLFICMQKVKSILLSESHLAQIFSISLFITAELPCRSVNKHLFFPPFSYSPEHKCL